MQRPTGAAAGAAPAQPATWETVFSSLFVHANLLALALDGLFLAVFGATLEDALGRPRFLRVLVARRPRGAGADGRRPPGLDRPWRSARCGAIAAVAAGYVVLHPNAPIQTLVPLHLLPEAATGVGAARRLAGARDRARGGSRDHRTRRRRRPDGRGLGRWPRVRRARGAPVRARPAGACARPGPRPDRRAPGRRAPGFHGPSPPGV